MISLNLLAPAQKEALLARVRHAVLERLMISLIAMTLASGALTYLVKIQMKKNLADVLSRQLLSSQYAAINERTRQQNDAIVRIEALEKMAYPVSTVVEALAAGAPNGIIVTSFNLNAKTGALQIGGSAVDRKALLAYEGIFRGSPYVKSFDSPISNLFQKTDISFRFEAVVDGNAVRATLQPQTP